MKYVFITILALAVSVLIVYKISNHFGYHITNQSLLFCALSALIGSLIIPKLCVGFVGFEGTIIVLSFFILISAYLTAYYDQSSDKSQNKTLLSNACLPETSLPDTALYFAGTDPITAEEILNCDITPEQLQLEQAIQEMQNIDELLDYAYDQLQQNNYYQAMLAFEKALTDGGEYEGRLYIVIELGNIYKKSGLYDKAIEAFSQGRDIAAIENDKLLNQEFINIIAYIKMIQNALLDHRLGYIPFTSIPEEIKKQINADYREWLNQAQN